MTLMKLNNRNSAFANDSFFNEFFSYPAPASPRKTSGFAPANVFETENAFHLELNVPGRNKEDFKVSVDKNLLTISYEKKETKEEQNRKRVRNEFTFESFTRTFSLDEKINTENIEARYENGLLKFTLPKVEVKKPEAKQIAIQ